jgi:dethiobiotin synthetase
MAAFFVTGSGTDIGKTWICAGLLGFWRAQGRAPGVLKPVVSGFDPAAPADSDPAVLLRAMGRPDDLDAIAQIAPFRLTAPLSPDQAAARESRRLTAAEIVRTCAPTIAAAKGPLLIEGAGGVMSPLSDAETMLDLAEALAAPVAFVAGSYLGALSHALTGLHMLSARGLHVRAVIVNETLGSTVGLQATADSLTDHWRDCPVIPMPRGGAEAAWRAIDLALGA